MAGPETHPELADALRRRVLSSGVVDQELREGALAAGSGGGHLLAEPYGSLARQIGEAAYRVTDDQVDAVRAAAGSDKGAFEVMMSASVGAGLHRWDAALRAIEEATDAAS